MERLISPSTLRERQQAGESPTVIDVRAEEAYRAGHIPGALHIPANQVLGRLMEIPRNRPVVTY